MANTYTLRPIETYDALFAEDFPFSVWLPYEQLNSERFECLETGEVWHRFDGVTLYAEDDDYPEGDLIEEWADTPAGLVCWKGKNGTQPEAGDVFQVLDAQNHVVFTEVISGETALFNKHYMTAAKMAPFGRELAGELGHVCKDTLGKQLFPGDYYRDCLETASFAEVLSQIRLPLKMRGMDFQVRLREFELVSDCSLRLFGFKKEGYPDRDSVDLASGQKWCLVSWEVSHDPLRRQYLGCCLGTAKELAEVLAPQLDSLTDKDSFSVEILDVPPKSKAQGREHKGLDGVREIWMRVGMSLAITPEEEEILLAAQYANKGGDVIARAIGEGRARLDGETYIPEDCVGAFNEKHGTEHEVGDLEFYPPSVTGTADKAHGSKHEESDGLCEVWMRVGMSLSISPEEEEVLLGGQDMDKGGEIIVRCISEGRAWLDGEAYIPEFCVEDFNQKYGTEYEVGDLEFYPPSVASIEKLDAKVAAAKNVSVKTESEGSMTFDRDEPVK